jgi:hypothetical protein
MIHMMSLVRNQLEVLLLIEVLYQEEKMVESKLISISFIKRLESNIYYIYIIYIGVNLQECFHV